MTSRPVFTAVALAAAVLLASPALAQKPAKPSASAQFPNLACTAPFVKNASHARMREAFGAGNVAYQDVPGPEGTTEKATVVFGKDPTRRLEVRWADGKKRSGLLMAQIKGKSGWVGPNGLRLGMPLEEVEKLNGRAFTLTGFSWDLGGYADLSGGALQKPPGGCHVNLRFEPTVDLNEAQTNEITGDREISSSLPAMRESKPVVTEVNIGYAFE